MIRWNARSVSNSFFKNTDLLKTLKYPFIFSVTQTVNGEDHGNEWKSLKDDLLSVVDELCQWTKGHHQHIVTRWINKDVNQPLKWNRQPWEEWKKGGCKELYLEAKKDSKRAVYAAKKVQKKKGNRDNSTKEVFKIAKRMKAENCDVVGEVC